MGHILFITGTDTGVGKTVFTGLILHGLLQRGVNVMACKPFCCGPRDDVEDLQRIQSNVIGDDECNPYHYSRPLAPCVAAEKEGKGVSKAEAVTHLEDLAHRCDVLLVEGAGGLMVPLGPDHDVQDLIAALDCTVWVVGRNALGTINHCRMTMKLLEEVSVRIGGLILMDPEQEDASTSTNVSILRRCLPGLTVTRVPYLGVKPLSKEAFKTNEKKFEKGLARLITSAMVSPS